MAEQPETPQMACRWCGRTTAWNPFGFCSWECYDTPRDEELYEDAPEAFAYFMGLAPGRRIDDGNQGQPG